MKAILLKVNCFPEEVEPRNGKTFELQELYELLSCSVIQIVYTEDHRCMIVDEEGLLTNKPLNLLASEVVQAGVGPIVGDALICDPDQID